MKMKGDGIVDFAVAIDWPVYAKLRQDGSCTHLEQQVLSNRWCASALP